MEKDEKQCPFCGEIIKVKAKKCKHCGQWLDKEPVNYYTDSHSYETANNDVKYSQFTENKEKSLKELAFWIIVLIIIVSIILLLLNEYNFIKQTFSKNNTITKEEVNEIEDSTQLDDSNQIIIPSRTLTENYNKMYNYCMSQNYEVMGLYYNCLRDGMYNNSSESDYKDFVLMHDNCYKKTGNQLDTWECINNILLDKNNLVREKNANIKDTDSKQNYNFYITLKQIDNYQSRYFEIINTGNISKIKTLKKHDRAIDSLFNEFENQLDKSSKSSNYLERLQNIDKQFKNKDFESTILLAKEYNKSVDKLLNEVYQDIRKNIPKEDFEQLKQSEIKYIIKTENFIKDYKKTANYDENIAEYYWCNMRRFRTLLLLSYL